ncbi:polysaccharide pyruvyl transferase family protein [Candidatus Bathyarchaeota archaeon]|nr:polysaccharide pyruvyl transferase family protein [Candidatus Bathyarchaeota archaeon]
MASLNILVIHVGDMDNKGSEVLLRSDIAVIKDILKDVSLSVSTVNVEGIKKLNLPLNAVLPTVANVPYKTADSLARRSGINRNTLKYKAFAVASLIYLFIQTILSIISAILTRLGLKTFYRSEVFNCIKNCDLVISCSDENFKEAASFFPSNFYWIVTWWTMFFQRTFEITIAKFVGKPIIAFPNSIGPFRTWVGRLLAKLALGNCRYVLAREPVSYEIVNSLRIGSRRILTSDTALLFKTTKKTFSESFSHPVIAVCPGIYRYSLSESQVQRYIIDHAKALDEAIERYGFNVILSPHYVSHLEYDDLEICKLIFDKIKHKDRVKIVVADGVEEFKSLLNEMDMIITSKLHPGVMGVSGYVPTLCIAYDHKQTGLFKLLEMENCIIPITEAFYERISSKIDFIWRDKERIKASLQTRIPVLQESIRKAVEEALTSSTKRSETLNAAAHVAKVNS